MSRLVASLRCDVSGPFVLYKCTHQLGSPNLLRQEMYSLYPADPAKEKAPSLPSSSPRTYKLPPPSIYTPKPKSHLVIAF